MFEELNQTISGIPAFKGCQMTGFGSFGAPLQLARFCCLNILNFEKPEWENPVMAVGGATLLQQKSVLTLSTDSQVR